MVAFMVAAEMILAQANQYPVIEQTYLDLNLALYL